jgi:hypothetical protein
MAAPYYDPTEPESAHEPYVCVAPDGVTTWHPISRESIRNPPTSSVTTKVQELMDWEKNWLNVHECHDVECEGPNWGPTPEPPQPLD